MESNGVFSSELNELFDTCRLERSSEFDMSAYLFTPEYAIEYNAARILCLVATAPQSKIAGKRKLVLLDFLLRDPRALVEVFHRAINNTSDWQQRCQFRPYEFALEGSSLEPTMVRFPLGPFDENLDMYLRFLLFRQLIEITAEPSSQLNPRQIFQITKLGARIIKTLHTSHEHILTRAFLLHQVFDGRSSGASIYAYLSENHPNLLYGPLWREVR